MSLAELRQATNRGAIPVDEAVPQPYVAHELPPPLACQEVMIMSPAVVFSAKTSLDVGIESGDPHPSVHDHRERTKKHRPTQTPPKLLPTSLIIRRWDEPFLESTGFEARSEYVERFWLPTLGPTATWLFRRFVRGLDLHPSGIRIGSEDTSRSIGLGGGTGRSSPLSKGIDRLCAFGIARWIGESEIACRTHVSPLTERQLLRLPVALQRAHERVQSLRTDETQAQRAMALAHCLHDLGDESAAIANQLNQWGFDPLLAHAATDVVRLSDHVASAG